MKSRWSQNLCDLRKCEEARFLPNVPLRWLNPLLDLSRSRTSVDGLVRFQEYIRMFLSQFNKLRDKRELVQRRNEVAEADVSSSALASNNRNPFEFMANFCGTPALSPRIFLSYNLRTIYLKLGRLFPAG